jgi:hypothetical protein
MHRAVPEHRTLCQTCDFDWFWVIFEDFEQFWTIWQLWRTKEEIVG